jgi:hypothetical protein
VIGAVHVAVGAAIGSIIGRPVSSFTVGIVSHAICDAVPHRDLTPAEEVPLIAAALGITAVRYGIGSAAMAGAVGALLPDAEHLPVIAGVMSEEQEVFPTHCRKGAFHGRKTASRLPQVVVTGICVMVAEFARSRKKYL